MLSDLAAYAKQKFNIDEQQKWRNFPGFSVLVDPNTEKWIALLMRQKIAKTGEIVERCDIKCGQKDLLEMSVPYISAPFRMRGKNWIGVNFNTDTDKELVYRLLDSAVSSPKQTGFTITLESLPAEAGEKYQETPITLVGFEQGEKSDKAPNKILQMYQLYEYGNSSFRQKCKNFYLQAKFMADYEDDAIWNGEVRQYFTTYHDLNIKQLRGYFGWRSEIRKGNYKRISTSLAYIYLYELINLIGVNSVEDSLNKMQEFELKYLDSGIGDSSMRKNIRKWMLTLAVLNGIDPHKAREYADVDMMARDNALLILRNSNEYEDKDVFKALSIFGGKRISSSIVIKKYGNRGIHLFSEVWRAAQKEKEQNLFHICFGHKKNFRWYPFGNAVYYGKVKQRQQIYKLNKCREYIFEDEIWMESSYHKLSFDKKKLDSFLHETDRMLRLYLKSGRPLKKINGEEWVDRYVKVVIELDKRYQIEKKTPKIAIQFGKLERIRSDANKTQNSLLIEDEVNIFEETMNEVTKEDHSMEENDESSSLLNSFQIELLKMLLRGDSIKNLVESAHTMPEVIVDDINGALFDIIGDSVVGFENNTIFLIKDYKDEVNEIIEEVIK